MEWVLLLGFFLYGYGYPLFFVKKYFKKLSMDAQIDVKVTKHREFFTSDRKYLFSPNLQVNSSKS